MLVVLHTLEVVKPPSPLSAPDKSVHTFVKQLVGVAFKAASDAAANVYPETLSPSAVTARLENGANIMLPARDAGASHSLDRTLSASGPARPVRQATSLL